MADIRVIKYGGSSVGDLTKMKAIAEKIKKRKESGEQLVVVVSAMGKTTNALLAMAKEAVKYPSERELDVMLATGEQVSMALLTMMLNEMGVKALSLTGFQAGVLTEGVHTKNTIKDVDVQRIKASLAKEEVVVVAGFQGINEKGDITTLGRGGSDTTAVALAAKLGGKCEIYTDVEGIFGVDPRLYSGARRMDQITYEEMIEMAVLGAKVMEARSVDIAKAYGVPVYVGAAHDEKPGTWIIGGDIEMEQRSITGLSVSEQVLMVNINHLPNPTENIARVFNELAQKAINVDMISQTLSDYGTAGLAFTVPGEDEPQVERILKGIFSACPEVVIQSISDIVKVSVVGSGMRTQAGVAAKIFDIFAKNNIPYKQTTTSEISISYTMDKQYMQLAVSLIAKAFEL